MTRAVADLPDPQAERATLLGLRHRPRHDGGQDQDGGTRGARLLDKSPSTDPPVSSLFISSATFVLALPVRK
jgi:hypothetical protein